MLLKAALPFVTFQTQKELKLIQTMLIAIGLVAILANVQTHAQNTSASTETKSNPQEILTTKDAEFKTEELGKLPEKFKATSITQVGSKIWIIGEQTTEADDAVSNQNNLTQSQIYIFDPANVIKEEDKEQKAKTSSEQSTATDSPNPIEIIELDSTSMINTNAIHIGIGDKLVQLGGRTPDGQASNNVWMLEKEAALNTTALENLPVPVAHLAATKVDQAIYAVLPEQHQNINTQGLLYQLYKLDLTDFKPSTTDQESSPVWEKISEPFEASALQASSLCFNQDYFYLFAQDSTGQPIGFKLANKAPENQNGWRSIQAPPYWANDVSLAPYGHAHLFVFTGEKDNGTYTQDILAYHTYTDTWVKFGQLNQLPTHTVQAVVSGESVFCVTDQRVQLITPQPLKAPLAFLDKVIVALYLLGMVGIGWYFIQKERNQKQSTKDFFRGGKKIPWWAAGMSLFATGASAISLMSMPGMTFSDNWIYFGVTIAAVIVIPIPVLFLAPIIRRLDISTANEYLEKRFGLLARLIGSAIFMFAQIASRMASVMLLPALALSAITGSDPVYFIIAMAIVTTMYTFLGGLKAVIWTDTIQGFVMIGTVSACLILAILNIDMPFSEMFHEIKQYGKTKTLDLSPSLLYLTLWMAIVNAIFNSLTLVSDQNFVQRVQSTPDLSQTKKAVATQTLVALPINLLLFALGTALWLYYRQNPNLLNPAMKTDAIYPFFAAQQLPVGISGLVVAALLAATMSTISSSICSTSDLAVNDFYRRFKKNASDESCLRLARILTVAIGLFGMAAAIFLVNSPIKSVWDLAIMITNLITNSIAGLFMLGLLTKRANHIGAVSGLFIGMGTVWVIKENTEITFWVYNCIGSCVAFTTGYVISILTQAINPTKSENIQGLTVYTLRQNQEDAIAS